MHIMIHACPQREWYVNDFLVPSLRAQGIDANEITVWVDRHGIGNLASCLASFSEVAEQPGETWHLQDDVIISRDFAERARAAPAGIVCGFCVKRYEDAVIFGRTTARFHWQSSFPCTKIPNAIAGEFVEWIRREKHRPGVAQYIQTGKKDDTLFHAFIQETRLNMEIYNVDPHLVDHVDWLIGGSTINKGRGFIARSCRWNDEALVIELQNEMARRRARS